MILLKCYTEYVSKFGKLSRGHTTRKGLFSFQPQRRTMLKNVQSAVPQLCLTRCDSINCNPLGSSVGGIFQARILEWVAIPFSREECSTYCTTVLISHASKVTLKILQARFHSVWTENFQMYKLDSEKAEEPEIKLPTFVGLWRKKESFRKKNLLLLHWLH